jgi:hypothetical protein
VPQGRSNAGRLWLHPRLVAPELSNDKAYYTVKKKKPSGYCDGLVEYQQDISMG